MDPPPPAARPDGAHGQSPGGGEGPPGRRGQGPPLADRCHSVAQPGSVHPQASHVPGSVWGEGAGEPLAQASGLPARTPFALGLATEVGRRGLPPGRGVPRGEEPWLPPLVRHTSGTLCGPPTCAHTNTHTHNGPLCPSPSHLFPSLPFPSLPFPSLPCPPLPILPSSLGLEHWVPEPGMGRLRPGLPGAAAGHTAFTPMPACPPQPSLATEMGTHVLRLQSSTGVGGKPR